MNRFFSVGEPLRTEVPSHPVALPQQLPEREWNALWEHGGFPEPFLKRDARFSRRWQDLRRHQLFREDIRDLTRIQDAGSDGNAGVTAGRTIRETTDL